MSITQNTCGCGTTATDDEAAAGPCTCGCCGTPASPEDRLAELRALRDSIDRELAELERA